MNKPAFGQTRRDILRWGVASAAATAGLPVLPDWTGGAAAADGDPDIVTEPQPIFDYPVLSPADAAEIAMRKDFPKD